MSETKEKSNLPEGWKWVKLGEVCKLKNGFAFKSNEYKTEGIPVIRISDIKSGTVKSDNSTRVDSYKDFEDYTVYENDILVAMSGATTGKFGIFKGKEKAYQNQRVGKFEIKNKTLLDNNFLLYQLHALKKQIEKDAYGATQPNISSGKIEAMEIMLPPKIIQAVIVSKIEELFSELDKSIENLRLAQQQLKTYRQTVLKLAFEGKLTNENIKESELPKGWVITALNQICKISGGVTKGRNFKGKVTMYLPYLRVANVQDGYLDLREVKQIEILETETEKYQLKLGDILYTEGGDKDKLGRGTIWKNEISNCVHQNHIFKARPLSSDINSSYIAYYSQTQSAKNYFFKHGKQTTNLASINLTILSNLQLPLCSITEQNNIVQIIEVKFSIADNMEDSIKIGLQQCEVLRQCILKMAFEGKLINSSLITLQEADRVEPQHEENEQGLDDKKNMTNQKTTKKRIMINELKSIIEILAESNDPLSAKDVWQTSIHKDDIDAFYSQLKKEVENGNVIEKQRTGRESFLILTKAK